MTDLPAVCILRVYQGLVLFEELLVYRFRAVLWEGIRRESNDLKVTTVLYAGALNSTYITMANYIPLVP